MKKKKPERSVHTPPLVVLYTPRDAPPGRYTHVPFHVYNVLNVTHTYYIYHMYHFISLFNIIFNLFLFLSALSELLFCICVFLK